VDVSALLELGEVMERQNRLEEAEVFLHKAERLAGDDWRVQMALYTFYYRFSDQPDHFEKAAHHAALATSLRPDLAATWNNLGSANFMLNQYEQAADAWQQSLSLEPTRTAYTNTGLALYYAGHFDASANMQESAIKLAPNDHRSWGRLGDAQRLGSAGKAAARKSYSHAIELARKTLSINDQDWQTLGLLGFYLVQTDHPEQARVAEGRALELANRNAETLYYAALVDLGLGDRDACLEKLGEAVTKDPSYRHLLAIDPDFRQLSGDPGYRDVVGEAAPAAG